MRNFFLLIRRYNFLLAFLLLQGVSFFLIARNDGYQRAAIIGTSNQITGQAYEAYSNVTDYLTLGITNKSLAEENAKLRQGDSSAVYELGFELTHVNDSNAMQQYDYISARVINNSVKNVNNYLTLDKGSLQGIMPEMAVISSNGVVGIVKDVSEHYSTVISILHRSTKISSKIAKNNYFGSTIWDGKSPEYAHLYDIPSHALVGVGDSIVTSTYSGIFPRNILVGTVSEIGNSGQSFKDIEVKLSTNFRTISYVYIVRDLLKAERDTLETQTIEELKQ
ncbi:MAG: rod shape-determining protein MreC [Bacteroidia bacterium]